MHSFIKRPFEYKETEMLYKVMHLKLSGSNFFVYSAYAASRGLHPLKQTVPLCCQGDSSERPRVTVLVCTKSAVTREKAASTSAEGLPQAPRARGWEDAATSALPLKAPCPHRPARSLGHAPSARHSPLPPGRASAVETFFRLRRGLAPCTASIFRNDPVAAMYYK